MTNSNTFLLACSLIIVVGYLFFVYFVFKNRIGTLVITSNQEKGCLGFWASVLYWTSPFVLVALWGSVSYSNPASTSWLPAPHMVVEAAWKLILEGTLLSEAWVSFSRVAVGFAAAGFIGVVLGLVAGSFLVARSLILSTNSFIRYIPPTAFIALLIVYFGVDETHKYAVVFFGVVFFIIQMVVDVVDDIDVRHIEMAQTSDFTNGQIFQRVIVPASAPRILDVLRINLGAAWTFLVAAELIGANQGLGHFIAVSQRFLRLPELFVGILAFGIIGIATDRLLEGVGQRWFRWHYVALRRRNS